MRAATVDHEFVGLCHFARESNATRAHDATIAVKQNVWTNVLLGLLVLRFLKARCAASVLVGIILQRALAGLIAHRAIDRVIDEEILHHRLLILYGLRAVGVDNHAFGRSLLTCRHELRNEIELARLRVRDPHFAETDAAVGDHRERWVVAIVRHLDLCIERGRQD